MGSSAGYGPKSHVQPEQRLEENHGPCKGLLNKKPHTAAFVVPTNSGPCPQEVGTKGCGMAPRDAVDGCALTQDYFLFFVTSNFPSTPWTQGLGEQRNVFVPPNSLFLCFYLCLFGVCVCVCCSRVCVHVCVQAGMCVEGRW